MTKLERKWAHSLLVAFAPSGGRGLSPTEGEVDYLKTLERMGQQATPRAALGLRLAIWMVALAPVWMWGNLKTVARLGMGARVNLLRQLLNHRLFAVRELTTLLKLAAAMALLGAPSVRDRSGYDNVQPAEQLESGVRRKLPLLAAEEPANDGAQDGQATWDADELEVG